MNSDAFFAAGRDAIARNAFVEAEDIAARFVSSADYDEAALAGFCRALLAHHKHEAVARIVDLALAANADQPDLQQVRIERLITARRAAEASDIARDLVEQFPKDVAYRCLLATALRSLGHFDDAITELKAALNIDPMAPMAHFQISTLLKYQAEMPEFALLEKALAQGASLDPSDRAILFAAGGKAYEDLQEFDKSFAAYKAFNDAHRSIEPYDERAAVGLNQSMVQMFNRTLFSKVTARGPDDVSPIFVFGIPRSGTTLTEQILSRHSETNAVGETDVVPGVFNRWRESAGKSAIGGVPYQFTQSALNEAAESYLALTAQYGTGQGERIVDKSMASYRYLGFLSLVFPNAKFVHCVRNPLDVAMSCYATSFGPGVAWSNDLGDIGRFTRRHQAMMRHWQNHLPVPIHWVVYEDLIADPASVSAAMFDYCELGWEDAVLDNDVSQRPIHTASSVQVRQPIYTSSKGRAARFQAHLGPLTSALGRAADPNWYTR